MYINLHTDILWNVCNIMCSIGHDTHDFWVLLMDKIPANDNIDSLRTVRNLKTQGKGKHSVGVKDWEQTAPARKLSITKGYWTSEVPRKNGMGKTRIVGYPDRTGRHQENKVIHTTRLSWVKAVQRLFTKQPDNTQRGEKADWREGRRKTLHKECGQ